MRSDQFSPFGQHRDEDVTDDENSITNLSLCSGKEKFDDESPSYILSSSFSSGNLENKYPINIMYFCINTLHQTLLLANRGQR